MFGNQSDSEENALNGTIYFLNINNLTYDVVLILSSLDMTLAEKHTKSQRCKKTAVMADISVLDHAPIILHRQLNLVIDLYTK